ncbi:GNAT family N-acetyltransferase [Pseudomonas sp. RA_105y_Pfl1_P41]|jgi:hypothetical protein|uniref:GNAT family N-acetyltransferase n=1 Tax=Pseudomonas sp. RA_105y_Pfl1_P41 TaxID=3088700 RepID=UPI0030DD966A
MSDATGDKFTIEIATQKQWEYAKRWAASEHWDLGLGDSEIFRAVDPEGYFIACVSGEPVSAISVVNYNEHYAHLGHYLTDARVRGSGYGVNVWSAGIEHAGGRCIGLDGMPAQESNYAKWGFKTAYRTLRLSGLVCYTAQTSTPSTPSTPSIQKVENTSVKKIANLDGLSSGIHRPGFISEWFCGEGRTSLSIVNNGRMLAFGSLRPSSEGYRLGPVYSAESALLPSLLSAIFATIPPGSRVTVDVPEFASDFIDECNSHGLTEQFSTLRMYRGEPLNTDRKTLKAIASLELG